MHVVSRLDRSHSTLVDAIIRMPWMTMEANFVKSYTSFVGILVSARPEYLSVVLAKLAQDFTYRAPVDYAPAHRLIFVVYRIGLARSQRWHVRIIIRTSHSPCCL
jgi:hypothetical protein